jgi:hypothetical protein
MSALSSVQLKCMIACDPLMKDTIIGVYSADKIRRLKAQKGLIVNTKPFGHEGEHWLAVYNDGNNVEVFDSLGNLSDKSLIEFHKINDKVYVNQTDIQCTNSSVCGHYCILYLFLRVRDVSFKEFLNLLSPVCEISDAFVLRFITRTFPLCLTNHV